MHRKRNLWLTIVLLVLIGFAAARASDQDETVLTVQVSAAEHEIAEGYFSLGDTATVMVKPGSELYRFLVRQRGRSVKLTLSGSTPRQLSHVERNP